MTADPENTTKKNMSRQPRLLATGSAQSTTPGVVIVGGGSGAFHAIESLREVCEMLIQTPWEMHSYRMTWQHGYNGAITVLSKEPHAPIDR